jgi:hypothetical protein
LMTLADGFRTDAEAVDPPADGSEI